MELNLQIKTNEKTKDNKNFFLKLCVIIIISLIIIYLIKEHYNLYLNITSKNEMIEVNAVYSNQLKDE